MFTDHHGPFLQRVPDGRLAPIRLIPATAYIYLALMVGIVPMALVLVGTAILLRRPLLAASALGVGFVGFLLPFLPLMVASALGEETNFALLFLTFRILAVALGFGLYKLANPHIRGHLLQGGDQIPLLWLVGPAFLSFFVISGTARVWMEAPLIGLLVLLS